MKARHVGARLATLRLCAGRQAAPARRRSARARLPPASSAARSPSRARADRGYPPGSPTGSPLAGGTAEWALRPRKRRSLAENLCHALGLPAWAPGREGARPPRGSERGPSLGRSPLGARGPTSCSRRRRSPDESTCSAALGRGNGVLLVSAHIGVGGGDGAACARSSRCRRPRSCTDDWLAWAVAGLRARAGLGLLYDTEPASRRGVAPARGRGDPRPRRLREGLDAHLPGRLLDAFAELPAGAAALARLCGTPIVPFMVLPLGPRRWRVEAESPLFPPDRNGGAEARRALCSRSSQTGGRRSFVRTRSTGPPCTRSRGARRDGGYSQRRQRKSASWTMVVATIRPTETPMPQYQSLNCPAKFCP